MPEDLNTFFSTEKSSTAAYKNRAFKYGDGVFESLCLRNGAIRSEDAHFERMEKGAKVLGIEWNPGKSKADLHNLVIEAGKPAFARIRMQLYRAGAGAYLPESNEGEWFGELEALPSDPFRHSTEVSMCLWDRMRLQFNAISGIKHCNRIPWVLAAMHAKKNGFDDALLMGAFGFAEASSSNIFIVKNKTIETPGIETGCLPGILRNEIIQLASKSGFKVNETVLEKEDILNADEIFLTNAFRGVVPVKKFLDKDFPGSKGVIAQQFIAKILNDKN